MVPRTRKNFCGKCANDQRKKAEGRSGPGLFVTRSHRFWSANGRGLGAFFLHRAASPQVPAFEGPFTSGASVGGSAPGGWASDTASCPFRGATNDYGQETIGYGQALRS